RIAAPAIANTNPRPTANCGVCKSKGSNIVLLSLIDSLLPAIRCGFDGRRSMLRATRLQVVPQNAEYGELETMKIATFRLPHERPDQPGATFAAMITETTVDDSGAEYATHAIQLEGITDVGAYLTLTPHDRTVAVTSAVAAAKEDPSMVVDVTSLDYDTLVPYPSKIFCIGLNYRNHILETGLDLPEYPTVFAKYGQTLTGPYSDIAVPAADHRMDYEGELAVIIGAPGKNIPASHAEKYIAGYAVSNDISLRGMQGRTDEWMQGKIFEATTPVGPWMATSDEFHHDARLTTLVNGE